jgi:hypothetical protein
MDAMLLVNNVDELVTGIVKLHSDAALRDRQIRNAAMVLESNKGAVDKHLQRIEAVLS